MLEQSTLHGRIYQSQVVGKTLVSKSVPVTEFSFGPMRAARFYPVTDNELIVEDIRNRTWYHYRRYEKTLRLVNTHSETDSDFFKMYRMVFDSKNAFFYYYGQAFYIGSDPAMEREPLYFVQNEPKVTHSQTPDPSTIEIPLTLQRLDYEQTFTYPDPLNRLLCGVPASYVDRYKRPVWSKGGRLYPVAMDRVTTQWEQLPECTYPKVVDFSKTPYGVADLEPEHTPQERAVFDEMDGFYEEETPRGGRHKIIRLAPDGFKFRCSPGLELISQSQVTLYGIAGRWLSDDPAVVPTNAYQLVGHRSHAVQAVLERPDVTADVAVLQRKAEENCSVAKAMARIQYQADPDTSHGEFMALLHLFRSDIRPYAGQIDPGRLPWILEAYSRDVVEHREKHETLRNGLPYLVYLAAIIIGREL